MSKVRIKKTAFGSVPIIYEIPTVNVQVLIDLKEWEKWLKKL